MAPHCEVHIFDPTLAPRGRAEVEAMVPGATFHAVALGGKDEDVRLSFAALSSAGQLPSHANNMLPRHMHAGDGGRQGAQQGRHAPHPRADD
jgi:hypothetical protein